MKRFTSALLAITAAQLLFVPAQADQPKNYGFYGSLEFFYQHGNDDYWDAYGPWDGWGGGGSLAYWINPNFSTQVDLSIDTFKNKGDAYLNDYDFGTRDIAVHLNYREGGNFLIGGMVQLTGMEDAGNDGDLWGMVVAAEGSVDFDRLSFNARAGYTGALGGYNVANSSGYGFDMYFGEVGAQYFILDNLMVGGNVGILTGTYFDGSDFEASGVTWGADAAYQASFFPVILFAGVEGMSLTDQGTYVDLEQTIVFQVGVRYNFGSDTLLEAHQFGANLDEFNMRNVNWLRWD